MLADRSFHVQYERDRHTDVDTRYHSYNQFAPVWNHKRYFGASPGSIEDQYPYLKSLRRIYVGPKAQFGSGSDFLLENPPFGVSIEVWKDKNFRDQWMKYHPHCTPAKEHHNTVLQPIKPDPKKPTVYISKAKPDYPRKNQKANLSQTKKRLPKPSSILVKKNTDDDLRPVNKIDLLPPIPGVQYELGSSAQTQKAIPTKKLEKHIDLLPLIPGV